MLRAPGKVASTAVMILEARREYSLLHLAAMTGDLAALAALLYSEGTNLDGTDIFGRTALFYAVHGQHPDVASCWRGGCGRSRTRWSNGTWLT
jgi:hypothetical protein